MGIRTRITDKAERIELERKAKGRHPILKLGSRHNAVFQAILEGNAKRGYTAAQIQAFCGQYHPQILKDLLDYRLVKVVGKRGTENVYAADPAAKGTYIQQVTVQVDLLEDEHGRFFTRTYLKGRANQPGRIIRQLGSRQIHFNIPLPEEPEVVKTTGHVVVDPIPDEPMMGRARPMTVDASAEEVVPTLLLEAKATIVEDE